MPENQHTITSRFFDHAESTSSSVLRSVTDYSRNLNGDGDDVVLDENPTLRDFVRKISSCTYRTTDADFVAMRKQFDEEQVFEILWASILGAANGRLNLAMKALQELENE